MCCISYQMPGTVSAYVLHHNICEIWKWKEKKVKVGWKMMNIKHVTQNNIPPAPKLWVANGKKFAQSPKRHDQMDHNRMWLQQGMCKLLYLIYLIRWCRYTHIDPKNKSAEWDEVQTWKKLICNERWTNTEQTIRKDCAFLPACLQLIITRVSSK